MSVPIEMLETVLREVYAKAQTGLADSEHLVGRSYGSASLDVNRISRLAPKQGVLDGIEAVTRSIEEVTGFRLRIGRRFEQSSPEPTPQR